MMMIPSSHAVKTKCLSVIDQEFDDVAAVELELIERCLSGEMLSVSVDALGVHDSDGVVSDGPIPYVPPIAARDEAMDEIFRVVDLFPHATRKIAGLTARDWLAVGEFDSSRRGITKYEWLWKRSRYLAGFP